MVKFYNLSMTDSYRNLNESTQRLSLEGIKNYLSENFNNLYWKLLKEERTSTSLKKIYQTIPHPDSFTARNPEAYAPHTVQIRIKPITN